MIRARSYGLAAGFLDAGGGWYGSVRGAEDDRAGFRGLHVGIGM